jgi:SAM-dependent methyltransferase
VDPRFAYPEIAFGGFSRCNGTVAFYTRVRALLAPEHVVLDVGCGRGAHAGHPVPFVRDLRCFKGHCARVIGIDVDPAGRENPTLDEFRPIDPASFRWPLDLGSVDLAVADCVLEHVADPPAFFAEAARVLRPGGCLCLRTPNSLGYVSLAARLVPNALHARVLGRVQAGREERDVFPTLYRCNTRRALRRAMGAAGFEAVVYSHEAEPAYLAFSRLAYGLGRALHALTPPAFRNVLLAFGRRGADSPGRR